MARTRRSGAPTQEAQQGYKFDCQGCESSVVQVEQPRLVWELSEHQDKEGTYLTSAPLQCCTECFIDIEKDNLEIRQRHPHMQERQVRELREAEQLAEVMPEDRVKAAEATANVKLDKLTNAIEAQSAMIGNLVQLMTLQVQASLAPAVPPPTVASVATKKEVAVPPKPKRAILAPPKPKKKYAPRRSEKQQAPRAKATKSKPSKSR